MASSAESFVVAILDRAGERAVGVGFVIADRHVVTCAHVVNTALGRAQPSQDAPGAGDIVRIEFPLLDAGQGAPARQCRVASWTPPPDGSAGSSGGDIAGLVIDGELPHGASAARLLPVAVVAPGADIQVFGYPSSPSRKETGSWAAAHWRGRVGGGAAQIDTAADSAIVLQRGYSGSPVVLRDASGDAVVGILQATSKDQGARDARVLPEDRIADSLAGIRVGQSIPASPYRGLSAFDGTDARSGFFVGREAEVKSLLSMLEAQAMVAIVGPSGVGKSSLVAAGLIPEYEQRDWATVMIRPGATPFLPLARQLLAVERPDQPVSRSDMRALATELRERGLAEVAQEISQATARALLIVVDQLEEVLASESADDSPAFIERIFPAADAPLRNWRLVVTLRADFYSALLGHPNAAPALRGRELPLSPMSADQMRRVIEEPAAKVGVSYEPGLAARIAQDANQGHGGLPLLEFTLATIWRRQHDRQILLSDYLASGGVAGALDQYADEWLAGRDEAAVERIRRVLLRLLRSKQGASGATRRTARRQDLGADWPLVQDLAARRLVVVDQDEDGLEIAELAHEALIRSWQRLAKWVDDDADFQRWLAVVEERSEEEEPIGDKGLPEAMRWVAERPNDVPEPVRRFVAESRRRRDEAIAREGERQLAVRMSRSLQLAMQARESLRAEPETALLVALEAMLWDRNELTESVFRDALDRAPAQVKILMPSADRYRSPGYAGDGKIFLAASDDGLELWDRRGGHLGQLAIPNSGGVAANLPGTSLLVTYKDGTIYVHDLASGQLHSAAAAPGATGERERTFRSAEISVGTDPRIILLLEGRAWVFTVNEARMLSLAAELRFVQPEPDDLNNLDVTDFEGPGHTLFTSIYKTAVDPAAQHILTLGSDATCRLWGASGAELAVLTDRDQRRFADAQFLGDGIIVTGTEHGRGELWDASGSSLGEFRPPSGSDLFVPGVHPGRDVFAIFINDGSGTLEVWDRTGAKLSSLTGHTDTVRSVSFSSAGDRLASGANDCTVRLWDWREARQVLELHGHTRMVLDVFFHPDSDAVVVSADIGGTVRWWSIERSVLPALVGHQGAVSAMRRAGPWMLTSGADNTTMLWRDADCQAVLAGQLLGLAPPQQSKQAEIVVTADRPGQKAFIWVVPADGATPPALAGEVPAAELSWFDHLSFSSGAVTVSPDHSRLAVQEDLRSLSGQRIKHLIGPNETRASATTQLCGTGFSPDGNRIVTAAKNGMVWIWTADGSLIGSFMADTGSPDPLFCIDVDPLGEFIATGVRDEVGLWSWERDKCAAFRTRGYKVQRVRFAPDGSRLISISTERPSDQRNWVELWDRSGNRTILDASGYGIPQFDESSTYFWLSTGSTVQIFDMDGQRIGLIAAPFGAGLSSVATSADGEYLAASFTDGVCRLWNVRARSHVTALRIGESTAISFSPDGRGLLAATPTGAISQHALQVDELLHAAARRLDRVLTADERVRFSIQEPRLTMDALRQMRAGD